MLKFTMNNIKEIFHSKICWTLTHPQASQDVNEFVSSSKQIWRNVAIHHLLSNGSSAVNGAVRMRVQTADKNITSVSYKHTAFHLRCLLMYRACVDYCDVFISCLDSHSDGTHSLQSNPLVSKWWNATFLQIWARNKLIYILDGPRESKYSFLGYLWVKYSYLKTYKKYCSLLVHVN